MLRITKLRSAAGAKAYYSKGDYYGQELTGNWGGLGAARLGLHGKVDKQAFDRLCDDLHPITNRQLTPRKDDDRIPGYDFTFDVPKGVSIAYAMNQDERILKAFRESVRETMEELEADMQTRVRGGGRNYDRATGNITWAEFVHFTARPVSGVPDMHLHAHMVVFAPTFDSIEERWKAGKFLAIKRDAPYFQAAYHARMAKRLEGLGYSVERRGKDWDLAAIPPSLSKKFSRRTDEIDEYARKKGITDPDRKAEVGALSRKTKSPELSLPELREIWNGRMTEVERAQVQQVGHDVPDSHSMVDVANKSIDHALAHVFERKSVAPKREILATALRHGVGAVTVSEISRQLDKRNLITRKIDGRELATTREVFAQEQAMLAYARSGRGKAKPLNAHWKIKRRWLNEGQQNAVRHVIEGKDAVSIIRGGAGVGKTSLLQEAVEAIKAGGHEVFAFAPSAEASFDVLRSEGFENATTVATLLVNESLQREATGQVLLIDEAGLLSNSDMKKVFDIADRIKARVILSGDWRQHSAVAQGEPLRLLEQEGGLKAAVVDKIQRQTSKEYRDAVAALAAGRAEEGFDKLADLGWIKEVQGDERYLMAAREYADDIAQKNKVLIVAPTHKEGEEVTSAIRDELKRRKLLGFEREGKELVACEEAEVTRLIPCHFTEAELADPVMYEPGMVISFVQNSKGHKKGERIIIKDALPEKLVEHAKRFQVFRQSTIALTKGDKIRVTANAPTKDGKHKLNNRSVYEVAGFTESGDIELSNGWVLGKEFGFLSHGYAMTSHGSQGKTIDGRVILVESTVSLPAASREQFYVSASRAKRSLLVITDDREALRAAVTEEDARLTATELVNRPNVNEMSVAHLARERMLDEYQRLERQNNVRELAHER